MQVALRCLAVLTILIGLGAASAAPVLGAAGAIEIGGAAVVATTEGDVLALRAGPGTAFAALTAFAAGQEVLVLEGPVGGDDGLLWYRVASDGLVGWCAADWLAPPSAASGARSISGSDGGVRMRDEPGLNGGIILLIPEGGAVVLLGADAYADGIDWALVRHGGAVGWVASGFLGGPGAVGGDGQLPTAPGPPTPDVSVGGRAEVIDTDGLDLRIRDGVGTGAPIFAVVPAAAVVTVVNGPLADETGAPWYGIGYDDLYGWVLGEHLAPTAAAPSRRFPSGDGLVSGYAVGPPAADTARGQAVVEEALTHLDTPYVWGGDGPAGWDCSGMIQWLYWKVAGLDLPRVSQDQFYYGTPLRPEEVVAGDLVFFFDTDGPGITHNGIALGDGRFIHARSAALGTTISWLDEPYWLAHYAGARRP